MLRGLPILAAKQPMRVLQLFFMEKLKFMNAALSDGELAIMQPALSQRA